MTQAHFNSLAEQICFQLSQARQSINIAVCWFSNREIFEVLKARLQAGVRVELLIEFDSQNIRENGLDFQEFIRLGGVLLAHCDAGLMHHKFAIVDDKLLLTGSFNWTYNANAENILVTDDPGVVAEFLREFERQRSVAKRVFTIKIEEVKPFSAFPMFEKTDIQKVDLRKKIAAGRTLWIVRSDKMRFDESRIIREYILPFDQYGFMAAFWSMTRVFDEELFENKWKRLSVELSAAQSRELRFFACRMKTGDIVLLAGKKKRLSAMGVIQSGPKRYDNEKYSSVRDVLWYKTISETRPVYLQKKGFLPSVGRFRGSGLRLLEEIFDGGGLM